MFINEGKGLLKLCRKSIYMCNRREWKIGIILPLNFELFLNAEHVRSVQKMFRMSNLVASPRCNYLHCYLHTNILII